MHDLQFLRDLVIVFGVAAPVVYLCHRLNQSPLVGFLVSGVLIGPFGLSLIHDIDSVQTLATVGVMILLFSLGLEFSLKTLMETRVAVFVTGPLQAVGTAGLVMLIAWLLGAPVASSLVYGVLIAISSTAVFMKLLVERGEVSSMHGRVGLGVAIFQDLLTVPFMILIPFLAAGSALAPSLLLALGKAVAVIFGVVIGARYLFPKLLHSIVQTKSKELFLITCVFMFLGIAWLTGQAGISLALGSFLAGLVLSESEYGHQIFADVRPFRDSLNSLFFVSVGMLVQPAFIWQNLAVVALVTGGVVVGKTLLTAGAVVLSGLPVQVAFLAAAALAQIGEFSFILLQAGSSAGLVSAHAYQIVLASSVITMILTPSAFQGVRAIIKRRSTRELGTALMGDESTSASAVGPLHDHVIICGFGVAGRNIARVTKANGIPYVILDLNGQRVREAQEEGEPAVFGDCTSSHILESVGVKEARVVVFVVSDPFATRLGVPTVRAMNKEVTILTRTKYIADIDELWDLGSREVIAEEFEASLETITRILRLYNAPRAMVAAQIKSIRDQRFGIFRERHTTVPRIRLNSAVDVYTETLELPQGCPWHGITVAETNLRAQTGAWILGIIRGSKTLSNPGAKERMLCGDRIVLSGTKDQLNSAVEMLTQPHKPQEQESQG